MLPNQFSAILVDDSLVPSSGIAKLLTKYPFVNVIRVFEEMQQALKYTLTHQPDMVFLDVQNPEAAAAEFIRELESNRPEIIIADTHEKTGALFIDGSLVLRIQKDVIERELLLLLKSAANRVKGKAQDKKPLVVEAGEVKSIFIKSQTTYQRLSIDEINYFQALDGGISVFYADDSLKSQTSLKSLETQLPSNLFCRVHKSYLVRLDKIDCFNSTQIQIGDEIIPLRRTYRKKFEEAVDKIF